jgi:murein DD-endopeptidase MepM/ murein hydrolase activator NlpD
MGTTADTVAVEVEARLNAASARSAEAQFDQSMNRIAGSAGKAEAAVTTASSKMGNALQGVRGQSARLGVQIGQLGSSLGSGMNPMVVFAQQASDFAYTLNGTAGVAGRVAAFFSGPFGAALLSVGVVTALLVTRHKEHAATLDDVLDKMKANAAQTALNEEADRIWATTIDGLTAAIRRRREEQEKALQTDIQSEQASIFQAQKDVQDARNQLASVNRDLAAAKADRDNLTRLALSTGGADPSGGSALQQQAAAATLRVQQLQAQATQLFLTISNAEAEARAAQAKFDQRRVENALDPVKRATDNYTQALGELNAQLRLNIITQAEYDTKLLASAQARDAAIKAARERTKTADTDLTTFLRPVSGGTITGTVGEQRPGHTHAGVDIAVPIGTPVRAPAAGVIIESGEVQGYGQAIYIDHGRGTITRLGHLSQREVAVGQQVEAGQVIALSGNTGHSTGPHLHFEVRQGGRPVDPFAQHPTDFAGTDAKAQQLAREREQEQKQADAQQARFDNEMRDLQTELLTAQRGRVTSVDQQLEQSQAQIVAERDSRISSYQQAVQQHQITALAAERLTAEAQRVAAAKALALADNEDFRRAQAGQAIYADMQQAQVQELQFEADNAKTGRDRRDALLALLDAETTLQRIKLQQTIDATLSGTAEHEIAVLQLQRLDAEKARKAVTISTDERNMSPGGAYLHSITKTAGEIGESVDTALVDGLKRANDELANVILGTESLGEAWKNTGALIIGELAKIAIQQLFIKPMAQLLFGGSSGGSGIFAALGGLFGGGGGGGGGVNIGGGTSSFFGSNPFGGFRASGGSVSAGRSYVVGENGPEPFIPMQSGTILPNSALAALGGAGGPARVEVVVQAGEYFDARVGRVTGPVIARASVGAARGGSTLAKEVLTRDAMHRLE